MKYCQNCGKEIEPKTKKCPSCNSPIIDYERLSREGLIFAILSIICWLIPLFGLLTSIPGVINNAKLLKVDEYKKKALIYLIISSVTLVLTIVNFILTNIK